MANDQNTCMHFYISGKVQGVWFRASTKQQAELLNLTGWACNLPDGRVEVMAFGAHDALVTLHAWLKKGPERARVTDVAHEMLPWQAYSGFDVK